MEARRGELGTSNITNNSKKLSTIHASNTDVSNVDVLSVLPGKPKLSFAVKTAKQRTVANLESIANSDSALSADQSLLSTNIKSPSIAVDHAQPELLVTNVQPAGVEDVYCLHVPSEGCFALACGAIVSNSDALGFAIEKEFPLNRSASGYKNTRLI